MDHVKLSYSFVLFPACKAANKLCGLTYRNGFCKLQDQKNCPSMIYT